MRRTAFKQTTDQLFTYCYNMQIQQAKELIQQKRVISRIPKMDIFSLAKTLFCFDKMGFKNKLLWGAILVNLYDRMENLENFSSASNLFRIIDKHIPGQVSVDKLREIMLHCVDSNKLSISHLSLIPFLTNKIPNDLEFWSRMERPILVLISSKINTKIFQDSAFNFAIWYFSEIKVGSPQYWHSLQALVIPYLANMEISNFSRLCYGVIKTHFVLPAFKQAFLDNLIHKFSQPSTNCQDQSMIIYSLTILEGSEKNQIISQAIQMLVFGARKFNIIPVRQCAELLSMCKLEKEATQVLSSTLVDFYNSNPWKSLETLIVTAHLIAVIHPELDPLKKNMILEFLKKEDIKFTVTNVLMSNSFCFPFVAAFLKMGNGISIAGFMHQFFNRFNKTKATNWSLFCMIHLAACFEIAKETKADAKWFDQLAEYLFEFCRSSKIEIDFMHGITNENLIHWNTDHVRQLIAVVTDHLPIHIYFGNLQRRYQCYNYLRTLDEILNLLLIIHFRHGDHSDLIIDAIKEIILKYKPTHRLEYYYLTDPENPALIDLKLPEDKKEHLPSILEALYGKPDLSDFEVIRYKTEGSKNPPTKKASDPAPNTFQTDLLAKNIDKTSFTDINYNRMHFTSLSSVFGLDENEDVMETEVEFTFSKKDSLGEDIVDLPINIEELKSGLLKDSVSSPNETETRIPPKHEKKTLESKPTTQPERPPPNKEKKVQPPKEKPTENTQKKSKILFISKSEKPETEAQPEDTKPSSATKKVASTSKEPKLLLSHSQDAQKKKKEASKSPFNDTATTSSNKKSTATKTSETKVSTTENKLKPS